MANRKIRGFTLVEMLVVIAVIGSLLAILLPAVRAVQARAQATQCSNNQHNLASAVVQYETSMNRYPGYAEILVDHPAGWPAMLLETVRGDLWPVWRQRWANTPPRDGTGKETYGASVDIFHCPSDLASSETWALSYVANCGQPDAPQRAAGTTPPDWPYNGVFHNHDTRKLSGDQLVYVSSAAIKDGTQYTLMLSENVQAGQWTDPWRSTSSGGGAGFNVSDLYSPPLEASIGMVWFPSETQAKAWLINGKSKDVGSDPLITPPTEQEDDVSGGGANSQYYNYARPSSNHGGYVIAVCCDTHIMRLREGIAYSVYAQLLSTSGQEIRRAGSSDRLQLSAPWYEPIGDDSL
jgi:prepilin-type N-terminal cleavage/methylation domain-containing protein